jgi:FKBP-type peptidyl-prolyl cis-trans isomerase SlyD
MTVTQEKYVTIAYNFATPEGYLLGTSDRQGPLTFCAGSGDIIPGLDKALIGAEEGQSLDFVIAPVDAYGDRDETLVAKLTKADLGLAGEAKIGYRVEAQIGGRWRSALISDVDGDNVTVDANHPLAGVALHFHAEVLTVSDEAPVSEGCGCGGGGCGGSCGTQEEGSDSASGSCGCGGGSCGCH